MTLHGNNIKAREAWLSESEPLSYIGIVVSEQTRTLYGKAALPLYLSHALGAFRALLETHVPVRLLTEADLEDVELAGIRVLVLPAVACLSDRGAEVIRRFVRAGGGLVATGETSLFDGRDYRRRDDFALSDLFHAHYRSTHPVNQRTEALQLTLEAHHPIVDDPLVLAKQSTAWRNPDGASSRSRSIVALIASATEVTVGEGGQVLATYTSDDPALRGKHLPAFHVSTFGAGRVVYFAAGVDKAMFFYPDGYLRRLIASACRWAAGDVQPAVEVNGPLILTATFRRQPAKASHDRSPAEPRQLLGHALDLSEARSPPRRASEGLRPSRPIGTSRNLADPRGDHPLARHPRDLPDPRCHQSKAPA